jgi:hypothetical protein
MLNYSMLEAARDRPYRQASYTVKNDSRFPFPASMSPTKLSLDGNNLIFSGQGQFG